ncbi:RHS repeat-associated core domain-containing protein [Streptomyces sp. NBC_01390]|uniref:RHS repeat-associated core domain-containing protein n=1 Tax=Streptomyces sp. NBC_01390 TaxID=2903850 RepID=UPI00324D55BE
MPSVFGGAEQITLNVSAKTWTGLRNITGPDGTTVTRSSTGSVSYQIANGQGTAVTAVDASTLVVTRRSYDPFGNPRGTKPGSWVAADENHGFLGQPTDPVTGLDLLGARDYDPVLGRFLSPDPVFEAGDPNQMGGYTYAGDNPASGSDPNGLMLAPMDGGGGGCDAKCVFVAARRYRDGVGTAVDLVQAVRWLLTPLDRGNGDGIHDAIELVGSMTVEQICEAGQLSGHSDEAELLIRRR